MINDGKPFEERVANNLKNFGIDYQRLHDQMTGLKGSTNPCDFIAYLYPNLYYIECKSCAADDFDMLNMITEYQWVELEKKDMVPGTRAGYLIWMAKYSRLFWISAFAAVHYYKSGEKHLIIPDFERVGIEIEARLSRDKWHYADIIRTIR